MAVTPWPRCAPSTARAPSRWPAMSGEVTIAMARDRRYLMSYDLGVITGSEHIAPEGGWGGQSERPGRTNGTGPSRAPHRRAPAELRRAPPRPVVLRALAPRTRGAGRRDVVGLAVPGPERRHLRRLRLARRRQSGVDANDRGHRHHVRTIRRLARRRWRAHSSPRAHVSRQPDRGHGHRVVGDHGPRGDRRRPLRATPTCRRSSTSRRTDPTGSTCVWCAIAPCTCPPR